MAYLAAMRRKDNKSKTLEGKRNEAEAVLKLADERLGRQQNLSEEIAKIAQILKSIGEQFNARGNQTG